MIHSFNVETGKKTLFDETRAIEALNERASGGSKKLRRAMVAAKKTESYPKFYCSEEVYEDFTRLWLKTPSGELIPIWKYVLSVLDALEEEE